MDPGELGRSFYGIYYEPDTGVWEQGRYDTKQLTVTSP